MAYITSERVKEIRKELKALFPYKEGWKLSVTRQNYSEVLVAIVQSPINFGIKYEQLNNSYPENYKPELSEVMKKIDNIISKGCVNRNANDPGADYADYNFFTSIHIGKWNHDCKYIIKKEIV